MVKIVFTYQWIIVQPEVDQILTGIQKPLGQGCQLVEAQRPETNVDINVCREKGSLLSFVYKFGQVARQCC